jgi:hypothetical protein
MARLLPVVLILAALAADALAQHGLSGYLLVGGVAAAAASALVVFGRLVELPRGARDVARMRLETSLASLGLVLVLVAAAARAQATGAVGLPSLTLGAIGGALVLYLLQTLTALRAHAASPPVTGDARS